MNSDVAKHAALAIQPQPARAEIDTKGRLAYGSAQGWIEIAEGTQMKNKLLVLFLVAASLLMVSSPMFAHHGRSNYDMSYTATVKGIVTGFEWVNPHALIFFDATDENGKIEKWTAETNSPNTLSRQGWSRNTVKTGDQITLVGHRVKGGGNYINFSKIIFADGHELDPAVKN